MSLYEPHCEETCLRNFDSVKYKPADSAKTSFYNFEILDIETNF